MCATHHSKKGWETAHREELKKSKELATDGSTEEFLNPTKQMGSK